MLVISKDSKEYVRVPVFAKEGAAVVNPTADTVQMAFLAGEGPPAAGDYKAASWETDASTEPDTYYARCLIGPGGAIVLTPDTYSVWVKVTDVPETPVREVGQLRIY
jgi:hypothetical protein